MTNGRLGFKESRNGSNASLIPAAGDAGSCTSACLSAGSHSLLVLAGLKTLKI